jgi:hypothetical protein
MTTSFHIIYNSLFINHPTIWRAHSLRQVHSWIIQCHIQDDRTLHNHCSENLKSNILPFDVIQPELLTALLIKPQITMLLPEPSWCLPMIVLVLSCLVLIYVFLHLGKALFFSDVSWLEAQFEYLVQVQVVEPNKIQQWQALILGQSKNTNSTIAEIICIFILHLIPFFDNSW